LDQRTANGARNLMDFRQLTNYLAFGDGVHSTPRPRVCRREPFEN
jgi:hypothetical protein